MIHRPIAAALFALLFAAVAARAAEPPTQPFLRIEAGGHISAVPRLAVDRTGTLMASAGYDKTVRLWSLPDGAARGVLRPPIGVLQEGEIYAVALTPDGRRVFAGGATGGQWDGTFCIYVFDTARGVLVGRLAGLPAPVEDLAVSGDGSRLAAGLASGGVRVWDAATGKPVFDDHAYAGPVRAVALDRDGRLFAAGADGRVRSYDAAGKKLADARPASGLPPWGLALSPDGGLLAVTSETADKAGHLHVDVMQARSLAPAFSPDTSGLTGEGLLAVAWAVTSPGGVQLLAGGYAHSGGSYLIRRWGDFGLGAFTDLPAAHDTIRAIVPAPGGGAVYATEDPGWGRIGADGTIAARPAPPLADLRPAREHGLAVSADGAVVQFATAAGLQQFALRTRSLGPAPTPDPALAAARTDGLTGWRDSNAVRLNGHALALDHAELSRAAALLPDGGALLGTDTHLRLFAPDGHAMSAIDTPAAVAAVTVGEGGHVAVAALLDGSLRWYGLDGGIAERASLFAHADGVRWVLYTPEGFFDDSDRGGNELVGIHLDRARNQQPDWISFSQAFRIFHAPDIVRARLLGDPAPARTQLAALGDIRARLDRQPSVVISDVCAPQPDGSCRPLPLVPGQPVQLPADAAKLRLTAVVASHGLGVGPLDLFVNDRNAGRSVAPAAGGPVIVDAALDPGANAIHVRVYDASGAIFSEATPLLATRAVPAASGAAQAGTAQTGRLFVLAIGIDHYANPTLALQYAVADAQAFTDGIRAAAAPLYSAVNVTLLLDAQAKKADILAAFDRLSHEIHPDDTFLFYVASHGVRDEDTDRFLLVPQDMNDISSWQSMASQSIDEGALVAALSRIEARDALLFLDTCHSGQVTADNLANVGHETGRYLLAASSSVQEALDSYDNHHGVVVYALREALAGRAGEDDAGNLGALSLGEYVSRRVGVLARQRGHDQDAVFRAAQRDLRSFPVARIIHAPAGATAP